MPKKAVQAKLPTFPPTQVLQPDPANKKRKQDQKEKEVMEERKNLPPKEAEPYKGGKYARVTQTRSSSEGVIVYRKGDHQIEVLAWTPSIVLDEDPLPSDSSIRDF